MTYDFDAFDPEQVPDRPDFELIPNGTDVVAVIDKSEMKPTKAGDGHRLALEWVIIEGKYENHRLFNNLNLDNPNPKTVEIAEADLADICKACGLRKVSSHEELRGIPCIVRVGIEPASNGYDAKNKVKSIKPVSEAPKVAKVDHAEGGKKPSPWGKKSA